MDQKFTLLYNKPEIFFPEDLDWLSEQLIVNYEQEIMNLISYNLSKEVFRKNDSSYKLLHDAFKIEIKEYFKYILNVYLFEKQHWKNSHNIDAYIKYSLKNYVNRYVIDINGQKLETKLICPLCKLSKMYEILLKEDKLWRCSRCTQLYESSSTNSPQSNLYKIFSLHSRKGFSCPNCSRFLPLSSSKNKNISCSYLDCCFFGNISSLREVSHPVTSYVRAHAPLRSNCGVDSEYFSSKGFIAPDFCEIKQNINEDLFLLKEIISTQLKQVKLNNRKDTLLFKVAMYTAFLNCLEKQPEDMIMYLCLQQRVPEWPIQPQIFQEYISILENSLPFDIFVNQKPYTIYDLSDSKFNLFDGISKFKTSLKAQNIIDNQSENYYSQNLKSCGPYFFGKLIDVMNLNSKESLLPLVDKLSFTQIKLKDCGNLSLNTPIEVTHYRLIPHYEINHMIYLQRLRKKIVNKVNVRKK